MIYLLLAAALAVGQAYSAEDSIDAPFAQLDQRYFAMVMSLGDALVTALDDGPSEIASQTSRCLGLLTPLHRELDTKVLRREMRLFARVLPADRPAVLEVARATAGAQAANIQRHLLILESAEEGCRAIPVYRMQRMRTMEVSDQVQELLSIIVNQPPTGSISTE